MKNEYIDIDLMKEKCSSLQSLIEIPSRVRFCYFFLLRLRLLLVQLTFLLFEQKYTKDITRMTTSN